MPDHTIDYLKKLTLVAFFSDDELVQRLVLKGGNALSLVYNIESRASFDLDFSMERTFEPSEVSSIRDRIEECLKKTFRPEGFVVFDVMLCQKPKTISPEVEDFWGGYALEFKLITEERYKELGEKLEAMQKEAIRPRPGGKARFEIDISSFEYCGGKQVVTIDEFRGYVYTPTMIVCEKIRAICQQTPEYVEKLKKYRAVRAKDFYDIHDTITRHSIKLNTSENLSLVKNMFEAKRVSLEYLTFIHNQREFHRQGWEALKDTISPGIELKNYDYYFEFVSNECDKLAQKFGIKPLGT